MPQLEKNLRNRLENIIKEARDIAEAGAKVSLEQLGVGNSAPYSYLNDDEKDLRRRLRTHGRQLGDIRNEADKTQTIVLLTEEVAYEHWHRMLFARFLAENHLLMDDDPHTPISLSLEECEELAKEKGANNGWELASRYAAKMLPQIFRPDSLVFELKIPNEFQQKLEKILKEFDPEIFQASDSLGWVYQFWQSKKKEEVNRSEVKIGAREIPALTQLFTESYMVHFLLDNSLGAWWTKKVLNEDDLSNAKSEKELREKASIPGVPLTYLRFIQNKSNKWQPAAGWFEKWEQNIDKLRILDPCCGSGHFLVSTFLMLVPMRVKLENIPVQEAADRVIKENLFGLEIEKRCVEIAVFALALAAWTYPNSCGYRRLPQMNIACCGLSVGQAKEEWTSLANGNNALRQALNWLYDFYQDAPLLGSLLNPKADKFSEFLKTTFPEYAFDRLLSKVRPDEQQEAGLAAKGLLDATTILMNEYDLIITNVPYLARGKQNSTLKKYSENYFSAAKSDMATVFLDRCLQLNKEGGTSSIVLPQNWLFLTTYRKFREKLLLNDTWHLIARLGSGAFETISGEVVKAILLVISRGQDSTLRDESSSNYLSGLDVSEFKSPHNKAVELIDSELKIVEQAKQLENPDARIIIEKNFSNVSLLEEVANSYIGLHVGGWEAFKRGFWELDKISSIWRTVQGSVSCSNHYSGLSDISLWENNGKNHENNPNARIQGKQAWSKQGIIVAPMNHLPVCFYLGGIFDNNTCAIVSKQYKHLAALWCFCKSPMFNKLVRQIDQKLNVTNATLVKVPFDLEHWQKVAEEKYPNGLPKPYSVDPNQWIFHGHPCGSVIWSEDTKKLEIGRTRTDYTVLQIAIARLLGYQWPAEKDNDMELSEESRYWVQKTAELIPFADEDGIVCIPSVRGEAQATDRLINLLAAAYGEEWSNDVLTELLNNSDHSNKSLESWLRDKFFVQHCKLFKHRPFIWQIWDGLNDGFSVLVYYHKLDYKKLETLIYSYLGDWITKLKYGIENGIEGSQEKLAAAENLKQRLELILEGEAPYDIFVRWKPLEKQPIGWNPDLNDGVRMNIRPFVIAKVLRHYKKPQLNINWNKDRGKDVPSAPWYRIDKGLRINDRHIKLDKKLKNI